MALAHFTKLYGVNDCAVYQMLTDPSGAPPTYASKVDVNGVKSLAMTLATKTQTLRGDNSLLAADSILDQVTGKLTYAKVNLDVWSAMMSSAVPTDSGSTPNQKTVWTVAGPDSPKFHKIEAQTKQVDYVIGDVHLVLFKSMPGNMAAGFAEENYQDQSYDYTAVPVIGTPTGLPAQAWFEYILNETAIAIV